MVDPEEAFAGFPKQLGIASGEWVHARQFKSKRKKGGFVWRGGAPAREFRMKIGFGPDRCYKKARN